MKVLIYMYALAPYKIDFCNEMGKKVDLTVLFEKDFTSNRNKDWQTSVIAQNFKSIYLSKEKGLKNFKNSKIINIIKEHKFDIIDIGVYSSINGMRAINYLSRKKIPFVFGVDGGLIKKENKLKYYLKKYFISKANYYLSSGYKTDDYLIHYGANKENIFHYPFTSLKNSDILTKLLTNEEKEKIKKELKIKEKKVIISIGQFVYGKGFDLILENANIFDKDTGIYIIGGEPTEEYLEIKERKNLKNVHFVGFKQKEELKKYYLSADVFVFPTRSDVWGLVLNEAMAYSLPVVTTNNCVSGIELIVNYENGFIVNVNDGKDLCEKAKLILDNPKLKEKMKKNNLEKIKYYTIENMTKRHLEIFKTIQKGEKELQDANYIRINTNVKK